MEMRKEAGGVNSLVAVYMHWDDGLCVSLNLVTLSHMPWSWLSNKLVTRMMH